MNIDLFETELHDAMAAVKCPKQVDVTDAVMAEVAGYSILSTNTSNIRLRRGLWGGAVAACAATIVALTVTSHTNRRDDEAHYVVGDVTNYIESYARPDEYYESQYGNIRTYILGEEADDTLDK